MKLALNRVSLFCVFFVATLNGLAAHAGFCQAQLSSIKYRSPFGLKSHTPKKFSENPEAAADLMRAARTFRRFTGPDLDAPSFELAPVAEQLLKLISSAKPFSMVEDTRRSIFDSFITEASLRIQFKKVSLSWLINFSYRASFLLTNDPTGFTYNNFRQDIVKTKAWLSPKDWRNYSRSDNPAETILLRFFDSDILTLPISQELGIFEINRLLVSGIYPLHQRKKNVSVEGFENYPDEVWDHDASRIGFVLHTKDFREFGTKILEYGEKLDSKKRAQLEFLFYYLSFEQPWKLLGSGLTKEDLQKRFLGDFSSNDSSSIFSLAQSPDGFAPLLTRSGVDVNNPVELRRWLSEAVDLLATAAEAVR